MTVPITIMQNTVLSVRTKLLLTVIASVVALSAAVYVISTVVLLPSYVAIERTQVDRDLERATDAIDNFSQEQLFKLRDWAQWDDSYAYAEGTNEAFLEEGLIPTALANLDLNIGMVADLEGKLIHILQVTLPDGEEVSGDAVAAQLIDERSVTTHANLESAKTGIIMLAEGPLIVSSRPLSHTDGTGPSSGTLIFGRFLDEEKVKAFADVTHLALTVYRYDDPSLPADVADAKGKISKDRTLVIPVSDNVVHGYTLMSDIHGAPALILKVEEPRPVYAQGTATLSLFLLGGGMMLIIFGGIVIFLLDRLVISRFVRLTEDVDRVNESRDLSRRVQGGVMDEIGRLAEQINRLFKWLLEAREAEAATRREMVNLLDELKKGKEQDEEFKDILGKKDA